MITDALKIFEEDMTIPDDSTVDAASHLDLQAAGVGGSGKLFAVAVVTEAAAGGTSAQIVFYDSADDSSFADIFTGDAVVLANLTKGKVLACFALPPDVRRYLKAAITGAGTFTAGKVSLFITNHPVKSM